MDTTTEGFFRKREINLPNFNLMLLSLNSKKDLKNTMEVLEKMEGLGIQPNQHSYSIVISSCAKAQNVKLAEKYFKVSCEKFGKSLQLYNGLLMAYSRTRNADSCLKIIEEMKTIGIKPDIACYTTLIQALKYVGRFDECFKQFDELNNQKVELDEVFLTLMMKVCAKTHSAEQAKRIFLDNKPPSGYYKTCFPYNAYIRALASRDDYAPEAEGIFNQMINYQVMPDYDSFSGLLMATSKTGNIKQAFNALQIMKERGMEMNEYIYNGLIRTYGAACKVEGTVATLVKEYKRDAWILFKQAEDKGMVSGYTLDNMMELHANSLDMVTVEGAILPMYEQKNLPMTYTTYEIMLRGYDDTQELPKILRIYDKIKDDLQLMTSNSMNILLHTFIRLVDPVKIEEMLHKFIKTEQDPKGLLLHSLGNSAHLPNNIYVLLHKFKNKYGAISSKEYKYIANVKHSSYADDVKPAMMRTRRTYMKKHGTAFDSMFNITK